ncbi:MAG: D-aminoacylase [Candidatus Latescibacteria bacterium]|nr:D-aminoacylase [Candidatus Latescibacterota bacterium]
MTSDSMSLRTTRRGQSAGRVSLRIIVSLLVVMSVLVVAHHHTASQQPYDLVIRGGTVIDGTGKAGFIGDVAVRGDRIAAIGMVREPGTVTIDAKGLMVVPGFIDIHSHSEEARLIDGHGPSFSLQGITTEIFGEASSMGPLGGKQHKDDLPLILTPSLPPGVTVDWRTLGGFLERLERQGVAANFGSFVGSGGIRAYVMGYENRPPTPAELEAMKKLVREAMAEGALGLSSALSDAPSAYMSTDELTALAKEAAAAGGIYATHIRTDYGQNPGAVSEAITIGERAGLPVHLFHLNSMASTNAPAFLRIVKEARRRGQRVTGDSYTYTWGIYSLTGFLPVWAQEGGPEAIVARLRDPAQRQRIAKGFTTEPPYIAVVGWDAVRLCLDDPVLRGKLVSEVAAMRKQPPDQVYMDLVVEQQGQGLTFSKNNEEASLKMVLAEPYVALATDGTAVDLDKKLQSQFLVHPRYLGTYPRWLGRYVREDRLVTWEDAIRKMTSLPAETLGLTDRGVLAVGKAADIVVFDPKTIVDHATFEDPERYSTGVRDVFVNGQAVVKEGRPTDALPGRVLRGRGYKNH